LVDTTIALDMETDEVLGYGDYLRLLNLQKLMTLNREMGDEGFGQLHYSTAWITFIMVIGYATFPSVHV
jgi:hypothetical protein